VNAELEDPIEIGWRYRSFVRRKKWEAELLANTVVEALSIAIGGGAPSVNAPAPSSSPRQRKSANTAKEAATPDRQVVPAHQFFKILESR